MNNYFPHDSNARNSDKLIPLRARLGAEGYGIYFMLIERLREEPSYMSVKDYNMLAFDLRVDSGKVKSVIEDFGLFAFTDDGKCFYSESLMRRMKIKDVKSEKARQSAKSRWNKSERTANAPDNGCERTANAPKSDAIKVKESKEDNDKSSSSKGEDAVADELKKQVEDYKKREIWLTDMSMKFHITPEGIRKHLDEFYLDMRCREIKIQKLPGVFIPWLSDKLQRKTNERANNNAKNGGRGFASRIAQPPGCGLIED